MKHQLFLSILFLSILLSSIVGCSSQPATHDFFAERDQFAANRVLQTSSFEELDYDALLGHVVESLLDLDCSLQETSKQFGLISAKGSRRFYQGSFTKMPQFWAGCAGHKVTVTVTESSAGQFDVRASFLPPDPRANKAFQRLLERSIAQARASEAS
jgi:hypothetical protein